MCETWLITGGAGFIGCNFVRLALSETDAHIVVLDKLTYAGNLDNLGEVLADPRCRVRRRRHRRPVDRRFGVPATTARSAVVNFAAESHVDRSIDGPSATS